jgi:hypothetical protein
MDNYRHGSWNVCCDRCGFEFKAHQLKLEWTGLRVCSGGDTNNCWEERHPQELVQGKRDQQSPPWVRPEPDPVFQPGYVWNDATKAWEAAE